MQQLGSGRGIDARHGFGFALALAVGSIALFAAGSARAGGEFGDAFEHELGRIAAHHAVHVGGHILFGDYHGYYAPVHYAPYGHGPRYVVRKPYRHHRHSAYCAPRHGWGGHRYGFDRPWRSGHRDRGHYRGWDDDDSDSNRRHYRRHRSW